MFTKKVQFCHENVTYQNYISLIETRDTAPCCLRFTYCENCCSRGIIQSSLSADYSNFVCPINHVHRHTTWTLSKLHVTNVKGDSLSCCHTTR